MRSSVVGIGNQLRLAREAQGKSLAEMSEELRIGVHLLEALENENLDVFSAQVYAIAFLRTYAKHLGLNEDATVQYMKETVDQVENADRLEREMINLTLDEPVSRPVVIGAGIIAFLVVVFVWAQLAPPGYENLDLPSSQEVGADAQATIASSDGDQAKALAGANTDPVVATNLSADRKGQMAINGATENATETQQDQPTTGSASGSVSASSSELSEQSSGDAKLAGSSDDIGGGALPDAEGLGRSVNDPNTGQEAGSVKKIDAQNIDVETGALATDNVAEPSSGDPALAITTEAEVIPVKMSLYAVRTTWIRISDDTGKVLFSSIIDAGESYAIAEGKDLFVAARDAGAIEIQRNKKRMERLGRNGEVVARRFIEWSRYINRP